MRSFLGGARLCVERLRGAGSITAAVAAVLLVVATALLERRAGPGAADRALQGAAFGLVLPLLTYAAMERAMRQRRCDAAALELARHGADRRLCVLGLLAAAAAISAAAGGVIGLLAVAGARASADRAFAGDLVAAGWIGALGGAAYAAWFGLGSLLGRRGGGRLLALGLDWVLGAGVGVAALPWPRAHVRNLLGLEPLLGMPQWSASLVLGAIVVVGAGACASRTPR